VSAPTPVWASRVYPDLPESERLPRLIEAVAHACRLDTPDPVAAWRDHSARLMKTARFLTEQAFDRFHYEAPGTDFTVGMPANQYWIGTEGHASKGNRFIANIPTDETFSAPDWRRVEGTIRSTRPAIISGNNVGIVDLRVHGGKIVEARAERHTEVLESELDLDERARYFGEIALVAESAPVAQMKTVFYDGLYDENAGCHLAFGNAYPNCIKGGATMDTDALLEAGLNQSDQHFDFTIGSDQLSITAHAADGSAFPVMREGEWSPELLEGAGVDNG
jgi:aminopeptidase